MSATGTRRILLGELLRGVSRSFYLTLRVLPGAIRPQIGTAYLLARATDTIADTGALPVEQRLGALRSLRARIDGTNSEALPLPILEAEQSSPDERRLLQNLEAVFLLLNAFDEPDLRLIRKVLDTITSGQELDLIRFGGASVSNIVALRDAAELHDYTFRVAGCVGDFWTRLCLRHLSAKPALDERTMIDLGVRFGQGLQLVNILRDVPRDLNQGRCYLPLSDLAAAGLNPAALLDPRTEQALRPVYNPWVATAEDHLRAGWSYVLALPRSWLRLRLACAWPILIGLRTIDSLKKENVLDPARRIKVPRGEVKRIMRQSLLALPFPAKWERLPERVSAA